MMLVRCCIKKALQDETLFLYTDVIPRSSGIPYLAVLTLLEACHCLRSLRFIIWATSMNFVSWSATTTVSSLLD